MMERWLRQPKNKKNNSIKVKILSTGEKVHLIQRRQLDKEPQRHFIGVVDAYEEGIVRVTGHVYTVDTGTFRFFRRPGIPNSHYLRRQR
jgi:hypothetical protein